MEKEITVTKKLSRGDVVKLKSGGPDMTVLEYYINEAGAVFNALAVSGKRDFPESVETTEVICKWFDGKKPKSGRFEEGLLEIATRSL